MITFQMEQIHFVLYKNQNLNQKKYNIYDEDENMFN